MEISQKLKPLVQVLTGILAAFFLLGTPLFAQGVWQAPPDADGYKNEVKPGPAAIAAGKKVYNTYCMLCHGEKGDGNGPSGQSLPVKPADFTDKALMKQTDGSLAWKIVTGRGAMPSWAPVLSEEEVWSVIHYLKEFVK